jgi:hypothetical protein
VVHDQDLGRAADDVLVGDDEAALRVDHEARAQGLPAARPAKEGIPVAAPLAHAAGVQVDYRRRDLFDEIGEPGVALGWGWSHRRQQQGRQG